MSKRCPDCGFVNEDSRIYCGSCGEPLDAELRLIQNLSNQKKTAPAKKEEAPEPQPTVRRREDGDDDYTPKKLAQEKKSSPLPWILLAVGVVLVIVGIMVLGQ